jgi:hypothetical protein
MSIHSFTRAPEIFQVLFVFLKEIDYTNEEKSDF